MVQQKKKIALVLLVVLILPLTLSSLTTPVRAEYITPDLNLLLVNSHGSCRTVEALELDKHIHITVLHSFDNLNQTLSNFDVLFVLDVPFTSDAITVIDKFVTNGGGLVVFTGPNMTTNSFGFKELGITKDNNLGPNTEQGISNPIDENSPFVTNIAWNSIPETLNYTVFSESNTIAHIIVDDVNTNNALLMTQQKGQGNIVVYAGWTTKPYNREVTLWPYFTYFVYISVLFSANIPIPMYADWQYSPVPHTAEQLAIGLGVLILSISVISMFIIVRRRSKHPVEVKAFESKRNREEETEEERFLKDEWERIGMHRQLGGFFYTLFLTLLLIIPYIILNSMIFPRYILPFPQAAGWYNWTSNFFLALWTLFDLGTSTAMVKYFAEYRVHQPSIAVRYVQLFVWWQMLSGLVQLTLVAFLGSIFFSRTFLAYLTWIFVAHSIIQFPGCLLVFMYLFQAMQRLDYYQLSSLLYYSFLTILGQYGLILVFRQWGASNPVFGEALGAGIGYALGQYAGNWMAFFLTLYLFKRLGFSVRTIFRADFSMVEVKKALTFGGKWTTGSVWVPVVWFFQMFLLSIWLLNYSAWMGYWGLAWGFIQIVSIVSLFTQELISGISESFSNLKYKLTDYYVSQGLKWANFFGFWLVSALYAAGARFILGAAGPTWAPAIILIPPLLLFQLIGPYSWLGDQIFAGVGRTGTAAAVWILEQGLRALFLVLLIPPFGMLGVVYAYIPALAAKDVAAWYLIRKYISRPKPYWWHTFIGPGIAALINYGALELFARITWANDIGTSLLLLFMATFVSLFFFGFFTGLTGSWDNNTLEELYVSIRLVKGVGIFAKGLYKAIELGCKLSPLHNRFPVDLYPAAMDEARELTLEKKKLVI